MAGNKIVHKKIKSWNGWIKLKWYKVLEYYFLFKFEFGVWLATYAFIKLDSVDLLIYSNLILITWPNKFFLNNKPSMNHQIYQSENVAEHATLHFI